MLFGDTVPGDLWSRDSAGVFDGRKLLAFGVDSLLRAPQPAAACTTADRQAPFRHRWWIRGIAGVHTFHGDRGPSDSMATRKSGVFSTAAGRSKWGIVPATEAP